MYSVCVHQVDNLPPPWGNCTTEKPKYYPEFTVSACQMDCENDLAREMCQCRDINMPKAGEGRLRLACDMCQCRVGAWLVTCVSAGWEPGL